MTDTILSVQLIPNWQYDILITVIPSLITGLVVGLIVGIILAKRQKKDRIEEEKRREQIYFTDELVNLFSNLKIIIKENIESIYQSLEEKNAKLYARTFPHLQSSTDSLSTFFEKRKSLLRSSIASSTLKIMSDLTSIFNDIDRLSKSALDVKKLNIEQQEHDSLKVIKEKIQQIFNDINSLLEFIRDYRAKIYSIHL